MILNTIYSMLRLYKDSNGKLLGSYVCHVYALTQAGATIIDPPQSIQENLVCVVHYHTLSITSYIQTEQDLNLLNETNSKKTFLIVPNAKKLAE